MATKAIALLLLAIVASVTAQEFAEEPIAQVNHTVQILVAEVQILNTHATKVDGEIALAMQDISLTGLKIETIRVELEESIVWAKGNTTALAASVETRFADVTLLANITTHAIISAEADIHRVNQRVDVVASKQIDDARVFGAKIHDLELLANVTAAAIIGIEADVREGDTRIDAISTKQILDNDRLTADLATTNSAAVILTNRVVATEVSISGVKTDLVAAKAELEHVYSVANASKLAVQFIEEDLRELDRRVDGEASRQLADVAALNARVDATVNSIGNLTERVATAEDTLTTVYTVANASKAAVVYIEEDLRELDRRVDGEASRQLADVAALNRRIDDSVMSSGNLTDRVAATEDKLRVNIVAVEVLAGVQVPALKRDVGALQNATAENLVELRRAEAELRSIQASERADISAVQDKLGKTDERAVELDTRVTALESVEVNSTTPAALAVAIQHLQTETHDIRQVANQTKLTIVAIEAALVKDDGRLNGIDTSITASNTRITKVEADTKHLQEEYDHISDITAPIVARVSSVEKLAANLNDTVTLHLLSVIASLNKQLTDLSASISPKCKISKVQGFAVNDFRSEQPARVDLRSQSDVDDFCGGAATPDSEGMKPGYVALAVIGSLMGVAIIGGIALTYHSRTKKGGPAGEPLLSLETVSHGAPSEASLN